MSYNNFEEATQMNKKKNVFWSQEKIFLDHLLDAVKKLG